jgi:hypothetical protein
MSLFSSTNQNTLTITPLSTARAKPNGQIHAILRLLVTGVVLCLVMVLTVISIFAVRLRPAPTFPGTQTGENHNTPRFVEALDSLQNSVYNSDHFIFQRGGDNHGTGC